MKTTVWYHLFKTLNRMDTTFCNVFQKWFCHVYSWEKVPKLTFAILNTLSIVGFAIIMNTFFANWTKIHISFFHILNIYYHWLLFHSRVFNISFFLIQSQYTNCKSYHDQLINFIIIIFVKFYFHWNFHYKNRQRKSRQNLPVIGIWAK